MTAIDFKFGIPDIDLTKLGGGVVNPSNFAGHQLIVLFCPTEPAAAAEELAEYATHASELCGNDAWIIGICDDVSATPVAAERNCFSVATDQKRTAWSAFQELPGRCDAQQRDAGAVFLFGRGGALQHAWAGSGHVGEVMRELQQRR